jgi:hypothetical protein
MSDRKRIRDQITACGNMQSGVRNHIFFSEFLQLALLKIELFHWVVGQAFLPV